MLLYSSNNYEGRGFIEIQVHTTLIVSCNNCTAAAVAPSVAAAAAAPPPPSLLVTTYLSMCTTNRIYLSPLFIMH